MVALKQMRRALNEDRLRGKAAGQFSVNFSFGN
jgi:hypothetical protein